MRDEIKNHDLAHMLVSFELDDGISVRRYEIFHRRSALKRIFDFFDGFVGIIVGDFDYIGRKRGESRGRERNRVGVALPVDCDSSCRTRKIEGLQGQTSVM